jgi:hypothetical protein
LVVLRDESCLSLCVFVRLPIKTTPLVFVSNPINNYKYEHNTIALDFVPKDIHQTN